jgi:glycerophosphoryl diester phosphodiesterase
MRLPCLPRHVASGAVLLALGLSLTAETAQPAAGGRDVVAVAHRGLSPGFPENTLAAFRQSIARGIDAIELDLRGTADGEVVVIHDATVDRTTDGSGDVAGMTLRQLKALDAGSHAGARFRGQRIPTYAEVLQLAAGTGVDLLLDIKLSPTLDKARIVRLTEQHGAAPAVVVGARSIADLREFRALNPDLRTLAFVPDIASIESFVAAGADIVRLWPHWIFADGDLVRRVQAMGRPVWTTADDLPRPGLEKLMRAGVDGILTDLPDVLLQLVSESHTRR